MRGEGHAGLPAPVSFHHTRKFHEGRPRGQGHRRQDRPFLRQWDGDPRRGEGRGLPESGPEERRGGSVREGVAHPAPRTQRPLTPPRSDTGTGRWAVQGRAQCRRHRDPSHAPRGTRTAPRPVLTSLGRLRSRAPQELRSAKRRRRPLRPQAAAATAPPPPRSARRNSDWLPGAREAGWAPAPRSDWPRPWVGRMRTLWPLVGAAEGQVRPRGVWAAKYLSPRKGPGWAG